jgi:CBS domain-containing protein
VHIGPLVTRDVVTVGAHHSVAEAASRMYHRGVGSAVVGTEDGRPGIITERDVLRAVAERSDLESVPVESYMTANAITASPSWDVRDAASRMMEGGFRHLIVLDERGQPAGILSIRDLVRALLE